MRSIVGPMADTFLGHVITKLVDLVAKEVKSSKGVHKQVKSLQNELEIIEPFLKHAEVELEKENISQEMQVWVKQVRKEGNRIEAIIDKYLFYVEAEQHHRQNGVIGCFCKERGFVKNFKQCHDLVSNIRDVKDSLSEIKERCQRYGLRPLEQGTSSTTTSVKAPDPRLSSLFIEKDELVGIERESEEIIRKLVEGSPIRSVISLVGEGGIGKTTLVKTIYDDQVVKGHFELHAWITVSRSYNLKKLLMNMKKQICKSEHGVEEMDNVAEQIQDIRGIVEAKRYMVVFDDVWQQEFWGDIKFALPNNNKGSRIVITTRNVAVANYCKETPFDIVHELQAWSLTSAWKLFCKKAFKYEFQGQCPENLKHLSLEIVGKCQGLPLIIATISSLLSTKEKVEWEWKKVLTDLHSQIKNVSKILALSYYDLPPHLKSCFLYFGIFPDNYSISDERLYRLWIAEGFVKARGDMTMEEVAEEYLNELIQRNLVTFELVIGEGKSCGVHDLMRDVILSKADEVSFCRTWDGNKSSFSGEGRRLIISDSIGNVLKKVDDSTIRVVFLIDIDSQLTESFIVTLFKKFKLLEVVDFESVPLNFLPKEMWNLFQLKYLSLRNTDVKILPKSISNLHKLQSLDIRGTSIRELPVEINELRNLRHLSAYTSHYRYNRTCFDYIYGVRMHEGFGNLKDLQTLTLFEANPGGVGLVKELYKLRKLRWFGIYKVTGESWRGLCASIQNMDQLQRLFIAANDENEVLDLQYISSPPCFLRELILAGRIQNLPDMIDKLRNLRGLSLSFSWLSNGSCKCLQGLPNLEKLNLIDDAYVGDELHFEKGGFEKLKELTLFKFKGLKHIKIDEGALPALEMLRLRFCPLLEEVPSVKHLRKLKHFIRPSANDRYTFCVSGRRARN